MKVGDVTYFCNCLLSNHKEHTVAVDSKTKCVYCRHYAIRRAVTEADIRIENRNIDKLQALKKEHLNSKIDLIRKDRLYNEKVN